MGTSRTAVIATALATCLMIGTAPIVAGQSEEVPAAGFSTVGAPAIDWERVAKAPGFKKKDRETQQAPFLTGIAVSPEGDVAMIGASSLFSFGSALAWHSTDGVTWTRVALEGPPLRDIASWDDGFVAIGMAPTKRGQDALVSTSTDGKEWSEPVRVKNAKFDTILVTPDGIELLGASKLKQGYGLPTVWRSTDAMTWESNQLSDELAGFFGKAAVSPEGIRLASNSALWRSVDGITWEVLDFPDEDANGMSLAAGSVTWIPTGFLLMVSANKRKRSEYRMWHSPDGLTWTPVAASDVWITAMASAPSGTFAFTEPSADKKGRYNADTPAVVLWSDDGLEWCRTAHDGLGGAGVGYAAVAPDGALLVAGSTGSSFTPGAAPLMFVGRAAPGSTTVACEAAVFEGMDLTRITLAPPVTIPPSMVAACTEGDGSAALADGDAASETTDVVAYFCASDLIAAGSAKANRRASKALAASPKSFQQGPCVKPAGGDKTDLALLCLHEIGSAWRQWQRETAADGQVSQKGLDKVLPMYRYAASKLDRDGKRYLDSGLSRLDVIPLGWARQAPKRLKKPSVVDKGASRDVDRAALHRLLQKTWLQNDLVPIPDATVSTPDGWERPDLPAGLFSQVASPLGSIAPLLGRSGPTRTTSAVTKCELAVDPKRTPAVKGSIRTETCGVAAASVWLAYLATGDERFIDIVKGIRDIALGASSTEGLGTGGAGKERLFFQTFSCWLDEDSRQGCFSGL